MTQQTSKQQKVFSKFDESGRLMTNHERWAAVEDEAGQWNSRYKMLAGLVRPFDEVLELGCGSQNLRHLLPEGCRYTPSDIIRRSDDCLLIDLNATELPELDRRYDICVLAGVLEYVADLDRALAWVFRQADAAVFSYAVTDHSPDLDKRHFIYGWFNHLSHDQVLSLTGRAGARCSQVGRWHGQHLYFVRGGAAAGR